MNINQVDVYLGKEADGMLTMQYENTASYISLMISDWIKQDFKLVGIRTLKVNLTKDFQSLEQFTNTKATHEYFRRKYLEGFTRFDAKFGLDLTPVLELAIDAYFSKQYAYEKEMKSKRVNGHKYHIIKRYKYDGFDLLLRITDKQDVQLREMTIFNFVPDPFRVHFNVHKVEINKDYIRVLNQNGKLTTEFFLNPENLGEVYYLA